MHGACLRVGLLGVIGGPGEDARAFQGLENGAYCVLTHDVTRRRVRLTSYNETAWPASHGPDFVSDGPVG